MTTGDPRLDKIVAVIRDHEQRLRRLENSEPAVRPAVISEPPTGRPGRIQTIQKTGKAWKAIMLVSGIAIALSGLMAAGASAASESHIAAPAMLILASSTGTFIFARLGAWWFHG